MSSWDPEAELSKLASAPPPPKSLEDSILRSVRKDLSPVRSHSRGRRHLATLGVLLVVACLLSFSPKAQFTSSKLVLGAGWGLLALCAIVVGMGVASGQRLILRLTLLGFAPLAALMGLWMLQQDRVALLTFLTSHGHLGAASHCASVALGLGLPATALSLALWRRTDPFTPTVSGGLLGGCCALAAVFAVGITCSNSDGWHLSLGHGSVVVVTGLVGALLGRRLLAP